MPFRRRGGGRQSSRSHGATPQKKRLNGLWQDGQWWCNCEPERKEAALRQVKKEGPNKGKFFFKCQVYPPCSFFLWYEEAKTRQEGLTASEPNDGPPVPQTPKSTQRQITSYASSSATPGQRAREPSSTATLSASTMRSSAAEVHTPTPSASKRKRNVVGDDEDDDDDVFGDMDSDEERQLAMIADKSAEKAASFTTPSAARTSDNINGLPTPPVARTLFPGPDSKRQKTVSFEEPPPPPSATLTPGPTPNAKQTPATPSTTSAASPATPGSDITAEVTNLLGTQKLAPDVLKSLQDVLDRSARRTKGIEKGRDMAREEIRKKDAKILELQTRITALENKLTMQDNQVTEMKANLMKMYSEIG